MYNVNCTDRSHSEKGGLYIVQTDKQVCTKQAFTIQLFLHQKKIKLFS